MNIPVCLMSYERPQYFEKSFELLLKTDLSQMDELIIFDDCSKTPEKIEQLKDLKEKGYRIIKSDKWGGTKYSFLAMLDYCFSIHNYPIFVLVQDDIIYNAQWLNKLLEIYPKVPKLGILTCWDRRRYSKPIPGVAWSYRNPAGNGKDCRMGGPCWLVTKALGRAILDKNEHFIRSCGYDSAFQKRSWQLGFNNACTIPSYVEHDGRLSIAHLGRHRGTAHNAHNFIDKIKDKKNAD